MEEPCSPQAEFEAGLSARAKETIQIFHDVFGEHGIADEQMVDVFFREDVIITYYYDRGDLEVTHSRCPIDEGCKRYNEKEFVERFKEVYIDARHKVRTTLSQMGYPIDPDEELMYRFDNEHVFEDSFTQSVAPDKLKAHLVALKAELTA